MRRSKIDPGPAPVPTVFDISQRQSPVSTLEKALLALRVNYEDVSKTDLNWGPVDMNPRNP